MADPLLEGVNQVDLARLLEYAKPAQALETTDQAAARLAKLSRLDYDRMRKPEAVRLGVRLDTLDKEVARLRGDGRDIAPGAGRPLSFPTPEPWPHAVDGKALLEGMRAIFTRFVALPDHADVALALWALHTYVLDACRITPRLAILSPVKRCGKTTLLSILEALVCKPCPATLISASALFRTIEAARPTFLIDEADTFIRDNEEFRNVVNSGHRPFGSVIKTVGEDHQPRMFSTFGPVALAGIGDLPDTIMDRSVVVAMRRRGMGESVESWREAKADRLQTIASQAARWADDNRAALANANPIAPEALNDRAADNWSILFAIADRCGGDWPGLARDAATALSAQAENDASGLSAKLLSDMRAIFELRGCEALSSISICEDLNKMEHRPWPEFRKGKPITPPQLARQLQPFDVRPMQIWQGRENQRGYRLADLADAFARYLGDRSARPLEPTSHKGSDDILPARAETGLADPKSRQANNGAGSSGLAVQNPSSPDEDDYEREERAAIIEFDGKEP